MTEAARAVLDLGFERLDLLRIYATHFARNPASGRVMQKAGMVREGCLRQHVLRWDVPQDLVYYGILREEWLAAQKERGQLANVTLGRASASHGQTQQADTRANPGAPLFS